MKFISCNNDPQIFSLKVNVSAKLSQGCGVMQRHCVNPALPCPTSFTITSAATRRCFLLPDRVFVVKEPRLAMYGGADAF